MSAQPPDREPTLLERAGTAAAGVGRIGAGSPRTRLAVEGFVVALVLGFVAVFLITQWSKLPDYDWRFEPGWLAVAVAAGAIFYVAGGEAWLLMLRMLGERLPARPGRAIYAKALVARYVPTSVLSLVGRVVLAEREGVPKRTTLASVVYEVGCSLAAAIVVSAYFVVTLPPLEDAPGRFAAFAVVPVVLAALHPRVFRPLSDWALAKLGRDPLERVLPFSRVLLFVVLYMAMWLLIGATLFAFASAVHPMDADDLPYIAASYSVTFALAVVTFVIPAGLGTREALLAATLDVVIPASVAIAIAVAFRLFQTALELLYVGAMVLLARARGAPRSQASTR